MSHRELNMQTRSLNFLFIFLVLNLYRQQLSLAFITKVQCSASEKATCRQPYCNFTHNETTNLVYASYGCRELTKPLNKINVHFKVYFKVFSQYYQIGHIPKFDYCEFINAIDEKNILSYGIKLLQQRLPESIRECPYEDRQLQVNNLQLSASDFRFLPAGKYKVVCTFSDDEDYKILRMVTHVKL